MTSLLLAACCVMSAAEGQELVSGPVEVVAEGFQFTEGPVWLPSEGLIFSDIPANTIYRADKSVFRKPSGKSNGLTLDPQGRLIACEHWNRRVTRTEPGGSIAVLAETYDGKRFNSPNDAAVRSDGAIFFTDPPYGLEGREQELDFFGVYVITAPGEVRLLAKDFERPNGIALSPDEQTLYVADTQESHVRAFDVAPDASIENGRVFASVPGPDGMAMDADGRLWCTSREGVMVFNPDGSRAGLIEIPQVPANCAFGGEDHKILYVTARSAVYKVPCTVKGLQVGSTEE